MLATLLSLVLFFQGIPVAPAQTGTISGVLRGADGKPLPGVRIAAIPPLDAAGALGEAAAMSALAQTDEQGRYTLEGIPQGRYYIAAGRVDLPTYFPGSQEMTGATIVSVAPGARISAIDFVMRDSSTRPLSSYDLLTAARPQVPLRVRVEGGGKIPVFASGKPVHVRLNPVGSNLAATVPLSAAFVEMTSTVDYAVSVENLPEGYVLQSLTFGTLDLRTSRLRVVATPGSAATGGVSVANAIASIAIAAGAARSVTAGTTGGAAAAALNPPAGNAALPAAGAASGPTPLSVVLRWSEPPRLANGVTVSGRAKDDAPRSIYVSGVPGTYYLDGSFEIRGVSPGRHVLATLDGTSPLGAFLVVGNEDIRGLELQDDASILPFDMRTPRDPQPANGIAAGTMLPLASLRGMVIDEESRKPIPEGTVKITGYARSESYNVDENGKFEVPHLFPGTYTLDLDIFGHTRSSRSFTVIAEDLTIDLTSRKLY